MEEIKKVPQISPDDSMMRSSLEMDLHSMENLITTGDITECDVSKLIGLYDKIYRLSRKVVYKECVVVDCKKAGYMKYFAPYFM
jgi:hypothetical protein